ncbi:nucleoside-diphosphate-sugar epimerase [alpha proteobacterium HIMB114]|nr:nucleoside-diphosphate-sugar epimerase [alpha proteobacterium HIMB114]
MKKKAFITGGNGFLGRCLIKNLLKKNYQIYSPSSKQLNLLNKKKLFKLTKRFDKIFHLAAWTQAGDFCLKNSGSQWIINQEINTNIISWWRHLNPNAKMVIIGTSCCYDETKLHTEGNYLFSKPHESLQTYAMTKKMLLQGAISMQKQFGMKWICLVPSTLYGKNYEIKNKQLHFIFDLIRKILRGKYFNERVVLWGDGNQKRELIHVEDFVKNLIQVDRNHENKIINLGYGKSYPIKYFAKLICKFANYDFKKIVYDKSKYVGAKNKLLSIKKINKLNPSYKKNLISIENGIKDTVNWFEKKYFQ